MTAMQMLFHFDKACPLDGRLQAQLVEGHPVTTNAPPENFWIGFDI